MPAYLTDNQPRVQQWYEKRNLPLTGCTVLHTSEGVMDTVGPDTGTDALAGFIQGRTTAGSYHDVADSDSDLQLIEYRHGAFHDGTGSNNWALSISFVCRTVDWDLMSPERRRGFLRSGARAFARQQAYRRSVGAPLTELRRITKAQSDAGASGFCYHGDRDPGRRTDPGVRAPAVFPLDEFLAECRAALAGGPTEEKDWLDMASMKEVEEVVRKVVVERVDVASLKAVASHLSPGGPWWLTDGITRRELSGWPEYERMVQLGLAEHHRPGDPIAVIEDELLQRIPIVTN